MSTVKTAADIAILREGGKHLGAVMERLQKMVRPGVSAGELDAMARQAIGELGDEPSFLNYTPYDAVRPYPAALCVSVNDEVVHGIPNEKEKILHEGDIVGLDLGLKHKGLFVDMAVTVPVGIVSDESRCLIETTKGALAIGINECRVGKRVNDIGCAIEKFVKPHGYGIVEELGGHGVGHKVHEEPYIANFCGKGKSLALKAGMILALEPMLNEGTKHVVLDPDGHTYRTADGKRSAHFEHTVLITDGEPEILTSHPETA